MKRLHLAASRFEKLYPQSVEVMANPTWIHLGDGPFNWKREFATQWRFRNWTTVARIAYRALFPRYTPAQLQELYSRTEFQEFNYEKGDPLSYEDQTFDFIFTEHFFEHLFLDEAVALMTECRRVLKPYGVIRISVPDADLRIYDEPERKAFPQPKVPWWHHEKHKTRWSIYSLTEAMKWAGFQTRPVMYCDKFGKFHSAVPSPESPEYQYSTDSDFIFTLDYVRRNPSLICDGIKVPPDHSSNGHKPHNHN